MDLMVDGLGGLTPCFVRFSRCFFVTGSVVLIIVLICVIRGSWGGCKFYYFWIIIIKVVQHGNLIWYDNQYKNAVNTQ